MKTFMQIIVILALLPLAMCTMVTCAGVVGTLEVAQ